MPDENGSNSPATGADSSAFPAAAVRRLPPASYGLTKGGGSTRPSPLLAQMLAQRLAVSGFRVQVLDYDAQDQTRG
ncbi:hypothetical protein [Streptomyces sp. bgisy154]|uniref:hypothetical protein n=1 Tax=Streptomyces sp. bgisy154 TaxID=3413794 RepID=UPI003D73ACFD